MCMYVFIFINLCVCVLQSVSPGPGEHPLQYNYSLWFSRRTPSRPASIQSYEQNIRQIATVASVSTAVWLGWTVLVPPSFWFGGILTHLFLIGKLLTVLVDVLCLFLGWTVLETAVIWFNSVGVCMVVGGTVLEAVQSSDSTWRSNGTQWLPPL